MEKARIIWFLAILLLSLVFSVSSLADGGGPELPTGACGNIPNANFDGPLIAGSFTAAFDRSQHSIATVADRHYNIHVILEGLKLEDGKEILLKKLYSMQVPITTDSETANNLCNYPLYWLMNKFKHSACNRDVAGIYGYKNDKYYPVITDVWVTQKDNCGDYQEAMISGTIKIRISPLQ